MSKHPQQTERPSYYDTDEERAEAALEELQHYIRRQDISPDKSTLDPNLRLAEKHLQKIIKE